MSSKLHRGGVETEPMPWRSVGTQEDMAHNPVAFPSQSPHPSSPGTLSGPRSRADAEHEIKAAYSKGVQDGQAAARKETLAQIEAMNSHMARTIEEFSGMRQRFRHEAEEDVVALALAIARRILHRELTIAPEALLGIVKAALEKIEAREVHRVRIRPEDALAVKQFLDKMGLPQRVEVVADPGLERGAAILDSGRGALDASVETQLSEIERGLADLVRRV
jgi:flagellar assembly protein FliH